MQHFENQSQQEFSTLLLHTLFSLILFKPSRRRFFCQHLTSWCTLSRSVLRFVSWWWPAKVGTSSSAAQPLRWPAGCGCTASCSSWFWRCKPRSRVSGPRPPSASSRCAPARSRRVGRSPVEPWSGKAATRRRRWPEEWTKTIKMSFPFPFLICYFFQKHCDTIDIFSA